MSDLKQQLIRLGATNPELRPHLRPILADLGKQGSKESELILLVDESSGDIHVVATADLDAGRLSSVMENGKYFVKALKADLNEVAKRIGANRVNVGDDVMVFGSTKRAGADGNMIRYRSTQSTRISGGGLGVQEVREVVSGMRSRLFSTIDVAVL